jgi:hypothetical protein
LQVAVTLWAMLVALPALNRIGFGVTFALALLLGVVTPTRADERLSLFPVVSFSEEFTDNYPLTVINPVLTQPPLFPFPPGVSSPPVNSQPPRPSPSTTGSNYDAISSVIGGATFDLTGPFRNTELDYLTAGELYAQNSQMDQAFQSQYVGFRDSEWLSPTMNLWLGDTFIEGQPVFGQSLIGPSGTSPQLGQALLQSNFTTNTFDARFSQAISERLSLNAIVTQTYYSTSGGNTSESFSQGATIRMYYSLTPEFEMGPSFQFQDFRFSNQPRSDTSQPALSANWTPASRWKLYGNIGPVLSSSSRGLSWDVGYTLSVSYLLERANFGVTTGRAPSITAGYAGAGTSEYASASASYEIADRTSLHLYTSYYEISGGGTNNHITSYGAGLSEQLSKNATFFVQYIGFQTNASSTSRSLTNNILIGVKLKTDPWSLTF